MHFVGSRGKITPMAQDQDEQQFSPDEVAQRRDEVVKRMLATPSTPHKPLKDKPLKRKTKHNKEGR
jgi:hypothetical protein